MTFRSPQVASRARLGTLSALSIVGALAQLSAFSDQTTPLLYLSCDEAVKGQLRDSSGNEFEATLRGKVEQVEGKVGKALRFDGSAEVTFSDDPRLNLTDSVTIMLWVNPEVVGSPRLVDKTTVGKSDGYLLDLHPQNHIRMITAAGTLGSTSAIPVGDWTHLAAVFDSDEGVQRIYLNGRLEAEQLLPPGGKLEPNDNALYLGRDNQGGSRYIGMMDEVRVYGRAVSSREIAEFAGVRYVPTATEDETESTFLKGMRQDIDYAALLSRNDLVYLAPALYAHEAMPMGNGNLCALLWNRDGVNLQINNGEYWRNYCQVSSGRVTIKTNPPFIESPKTFHQRLSLWDGCVHTRAETVEGPVDIISFVAEGRDLIVIHVRDGRKATAEVDLHLWNTQGMDRKGAQFIAAPDLIAVTEPSTHEKDPWLDRTMVNAVTVEGATFTTETADDRTVRLKLGSSHEYTIFITAPAVDLTRDAVSVARELFSSAKRKGWQGLLKERQEYWHTFWQKSYVYLSSGKGEADYMENLWYLNFYWLASQSRGAYCPKFNGGTFLTNFDWRGWGGSYWYQNTRELFWPTLAANHPELCKPFHDLYSRVMPKEREHARNLFNKNGAQYQETMVVNGEGDKAGNPYTFLYLTTGLECAFEFYKWYEYTQDEAFLREKAYPLLKECVDFYLDYAAKGDDGLYHLYPTDSRETYWRVQDAHTDLAALRAALPVLLRESDRLKLDANLRSRWKELLDHLPPYPVDTKLNRYAPCTFLQDPPKTDNPYVERLYPPERTSHSWDQRFNSENTECDLIYPWGGAGLESSNCELAKSTYLQRTFRSSSGWDPAAIWAARLGLGEEAGRVLLEHARNSQVWTQGFWNSPASIYWGGILYDAPYFDPPGVSATALNEMMLQSHTDTIRVFPAWPKRWRGAFRLRARQGFMVSSEVSGGKAHYVLIQSLRGGACVLANPWVGEVTLTERSGKVRSLHGKSLVFSTVKGQTYRLMPTKRLGTKPEFQRLVPKPNSGPKWPVANDPQQTADDYLKTGATNFLGIAAEGLTPLRVRVKAEAARRQDELRQLIGNRPNVAAGAKAFVAAANQPDRLASQLTDGRFGEANQVVGPPGGCFVVDLGKPQAVAALLWSRDRLCELNYNGITDYEIEVSDDGQQWKSVLQVRGNREVWGRFEHFEPVTARLVRLQVRNSSYEPVVDEVEVYGVAK